MFPELLPETVSFDDASVLLIITKKKSSKRQQKVYLMEISNPRESFTDHENFPLIGIENVNKKRVGKFLFSASNMN